MRRLLLLAVLAAAMASACGSSGGRTIVAEFTDVGDLVPRANVQQSDAVVGTIRSIDLVQRGDEWVARVALRLDPDAKVTRGTRAIVRSTSLLGEKYVDLVAPRGPGTELPDDAVIPVGNNAKAPELEAVFSQLGALLQSGGLEDLAKLTSASAMILEGREEDVGRVLDGTAKLLASLRAQKDALASGVADLASASKTLNARRDTLGKALDVSDDALSIVASQQHELDDLVVQLDKLGKPLADLTRAHKDDTDAQVKALNKIVPQLYGVRSTLEHALRELPDFTRLFARAAPGDYVQLDVFVEALPIGSPSEGSSLEEMLLEATR